MTVSSTSIVILLLNIISEASIVFLDLFRVQTRFLTNQRTRTFTSLRHNVCDWTTYFRVLMGLVLELRCWCLRVQRLSTISKTVLFFISCANCRFIMKALEASSTLNTLKKSWISCWQPIIWVYLEIRIRKIRTRLSSFISTCVSIKDVFASWRKFVIVMALLFKNGRLLRFSLRPSLLQYFRSHILLFLKILLNDHVLRWRWRNEFITGSETCV